MQDDFREIIEKAKAMKHAFDNCHGHIYKPSGPSRIIYSIIPADRQFEFPPASWACIKCGKRIGSRALQNAIGRKFSFFHA